MAKPALGRGLGTLLNGSGKAAPAPSGEGQLSLPGTAETPVGRGFNTLLQGSGADAAPAANEIATPAAPRPSLVAPRSFFFFLDFLFLTAAAVIVMSGSEPPTPFEWTFSVIAILAGATCALIPLKSRWLLRPVAGQDSERWQIRTAMDEQGSTQAYVIHEHFPRFIAKVHPSPDTAQSLAPVWLDAPEPDPRQASALLAEGLDHYRSKRPENTLSKRQFSKALRKI